MTVCAIRFLLLVPRSAGDCADEGERLTSEPCSACRMAVAPDAPPRKVLTCQSIAGSERARGKSGAAANRLSHGRDQAVWK